MPKLNLEMLGRSGDQQRAAFGRAGTFVSFSLSNPGKQQADGLFFVRGKQTLESTGCTPVPGTDQIQGVLLEI